jgi:predicted Fe-S protein YdhL (DUF1289 family)
MVPVDSPCTKICTIDPASGLCIGCGRTLSEIAQWLALSANDRRRIMAELPTRMARRDRKPVAEAEVG